MRHKTAMLAAGLAIWAAAAQADPKEYRFEAVQAQLPVSASARLSVRLIHLPTGKAVTDAVLFQPRFEMPMGSMGAMGTKITAAAPDGTGLYPFVADITMAGPWTLSVSAKVQGEAATISGVVPFTAVAADHGHAH